MMRSIEVNSPSIRLWRVKFGGPGAELGCGQPAQSDRNREFTEIYNLLAITADAHGCAFVLPSHSSKGDQSRRKSIDVGSGAGAQGRACDTHIVLRDHPRISGLAQMTVDVRSFAAIEPVSLRFEWPLWIVANEDDYKPEPPPPPFTTSDLLALLAAEPVGRREFVKRTYADHKARIKKVDLEILLQDAIDKGLIVATSGNGRRAETIRTPQEAAA